MRVYMLKKDRTNNKTIDDYLAIAKSDIYVYIVVTILVFIGVLYIFFTRTLLSPLVLQRKSLIHHTGPLDTVSRICTAACL